MNLSIKSTVFFSAINICISYILAYVFIAIAFVFIVSSEAFPLAFYPIDDDRDSSPTFVRREDIFDPYGFNSILTRFVKRDRDDDIDLIGEQQDVYNYV